MESFIIWASYIMGKKVDSGIRLSDLNPNAVAGSVILDKLLGQVITPHFKIGIILLSPLEGSKK